MLLHELLFINFCVALLLFILFIGLR